MDDWKKAASDLDSSLSIAKFDAASGKCLRVINREKDLLKSSCSVQSCLKNIEKQFNVPWNAAKVTPSLKQRFSELALASSQVKIALGNRCKKLTTKNP